MYRSIRGFVWEKARIYVVSVKGKHVCKLGFAEVCGKKCLIFSAGLLISVSELYVSVSWLIVLKSMERVQSENMMKRGLQVVFY